MGDPVGADGNTRLDDDVIGGWGNVCCCCCCDRDEVAVVVLVIIVLFTWEFVELCRGVGSEEERESTD